jgi:hypothetical protein
VIQVVNCRLPQEVRFTIVYIYKCSINKVFIIIIIIIIFIIIVIIIIIIIITTKNTALDEWLRLRSEQLTIYFAAETNNGQIRNYYPFKNCTIYLLFVIIVILCMYSYYWFK